MKTIEIYWQDLTEEAKNAIIEACPCVKDNNWDVFPMAIIDIDEDMWDSEV